MSEGDTNSDDLFREPNDNAFEKQELRSGPPLAYVAEKYRRSLEALHGAMAELNCHGTELIGEVPGLWMVDVAFRSGLVGYLALHNLLALANDGELPDRLLRYSKDDFVEWLDRIDRGGSVTG